MKKRDIILISSLFLIALLAFLTVWLWPKEAMNKAHVYHDSKVYVTIDFENKKLIETQRTDHDLLYSYNESDALYLNYQKPDGHDIIILFGSFLVKGEPSKVYIEINWASRSVRILHDETPKQIGVNRDWYDGSGLPVISAPSKVYVEFEGAKHIPDDVDGKV